MGRSVFWDGWSDSGRFNFRLNGKAGDYMDDEISALMVFLEQRNP